MISRSLQVAGLRELRTAQRPHEEVFALWVGFEAKRILDNRVDFCCTPPVEKNRAVNDRTSYPDRYEFFPMEVS